MYPLCELPSGREAHPASRNATKRTLSAKMRTNLTSTSNADAGTRLPDDLPGTNNRNASDAGPVGSNTDRRVG
eukprot:11155841-Lingulodinium_polyedra.AAC.1